MTTSETYKGAFTDIPSIVDHIIQSRTYYAGEKGEEVADFTHNFGQLKDAWGIKSTSFFYYGSESKRASAVDNETAMTMSETYKGEIAVIDPAKLQSRTFYVGIKGDEVADYSYNYKLGPRQ